MSSFKNLISKASTNNTTMHYIKASAFNVKYDIEVKFKFSRINGDSGTNKTNFCITVDNAINGIYGYTLFSDLKVVVLAKNKSTSLSMIETTTEDAIFIFDENCHWVSDNDFVDILRNSKGSYFIAVTRSKLSNLSYDYRAIYNFDQVDGVIRNIPILDDCIFKNNGTYYDIQNVVTEDTNSGRQLFTEISKLPVIGCLTDSRGKEYSSKSMIRYRHKDCLCIVDGSAFGSCIEECIKVFSTSTLYLINSVEWLLLKSNVCNDDSVFNVEDEYVYSGYASYEEMCTAILMKVTEGTKFQYNKSRINSAWLEYTVLCKTVSLLDRRLVKFYVKDVFLS